MTPEPIPQDLIAVHDLLRETVAAARDSGGPFQYGLAVFPRTGRFGAPVFGIATSGGESTVLTYRMLQSLVELPVYISGRVPATIREGLSYGPPRVIPVALIWTSRYCGWDSPAASARAVTISTAPSRWRPASLPAILPRPSSSSSTCGRTAASGHPPACDPGAPPPGPAADDYAQLLADVLGRVGERAVELAAVADARGISGQACEQAYDALNASPQAVDPIRN